MMHSPNSNTSYLLLNIHNSFEVRVYWYYTYYQLFCIQRKDFTKNLCWWYVNNELSFVFAIKKDMHFPLLHTASTLHRLDAYEAVKIF